MLDLPLVLLAVDERVAGADGVWARGFARRVWLGAGFGGEFGAEGAALGGDDWSLVRWLVWVGGVGV